ncbi:MAG TPA: SDR family NAD(P)-dependent oxidoreductase [Candidatus Methylomirabilis sp.]|nr:SDR family NAD(P)-dependent oxidoreductase [Candidatus Methylomirabilis sp.]
MLRTMKEEIDLQRLLDRNAIVTGGAQGMGLAIAQAFNREGARLLLMDVNEEAVATAAKQIDAVGARAVGRRADVTKPDDVRAAIRELKAFWGTVDILVNNAGGALHTPHVLAEIQEQDWNLVVDVNLKGAFLCCQAVIPEMVKQGRGVIVNMSALAGHWRASLAGVQYVAAKAGVEGLTRQLAYDWGKAGIRVNAVAPTVTLTGDRIQGLWEAKSEEEKKTVLSAIPLGRLGTMEEVASAVVFLASDESSFITGITLDVNGGRYLR